MPLPNHSSLELSVYQLVRARLTFVANTQANQELCAIYTLEVMEELEPCFKVEKQEPPTNVVGDENSYTTAQRSVIADLVSYYMLFRHSVVTTAGDPTAGVTPLTSFLKSAKAGSVAVEFEQLDAKSSLMASTVASMMDLMKKSAIRKARALGCVIDICEDCSLSVSCMIPDAPIFRVTNVARGCNPCSDIPERG